MEEIADADPSYAMEVGGNIVDAIKKGNFTRFINFSDAQANAAFIPGYADHRKTVFLKTIKPVREGDQLLIDYNKYDEHASLDYCFLNPEDGWVSTEEMYLQQQEHYSLVRCPITLPLLDLHRRDLIHATAVGEMILSGKSLESLGVEYDSIVNTPFLKTDRLGGIIDATKTDLFTPLMLACVLGQSKNSQWLIEHGASINQQQNHSGNCPLFLALQGYQLNERSRPLYMAVMRQLIKSNVNLNVHDRFDQTFLHQAISILTPLDFKEMIGLITSEPEHDFFGLFDYLDNQNNDIVTACIQSQRFEYLRILLQAYPMYFKHHYSKGPLSDRKDNLERLTQATESYSDESKEILIRLFIDLRIGLSPRFLELSGLSCSASIGMMP